MIKLIGINKTYTNKRKIKTKALVDVNLNLEQCGLVFILGRSGSGKSTLLNLLGGLDKSDSGQILVDEQELSKFSRKEMDAYRNSYIGFIFQEFNLIDSYTVYQNIELALSLQGIKASYEEMDAVLASLDLEGIGNSLPNELSGGQRQRVAIARALIKKPKVLLADEPTGSLDTQTGNAIFKCLKERAKDHLVLVITHDEEFAKTYGDRIIKIEDGRIANDTTYNEDTEALSISKQNITPSLNVRQAAKFGISNLRHKKFKLVMSVLLTSFTLVMLALSSATSSFEKVIAHKTVLNKNEALSQAEIVGYSDDMRPGMLVNLSSTDLNKIKEITKLDYRPRYVYINELSSQDNNNVSTNIYNFKEDNNLYYNTLGTLMFINDIADNTEELKNIVGRLPKADDEIVITSYLAELLVHGNYEAYKPTSINAILSENKPIDLGPLKQVKIVGINNVDVSHFDKLKTATFDSIRNDDELNLLNSKYTSYQNIVTNNIYTTKTAINKINEESNHYIEFVKNNLINTESLNKHNYYETEYSYHARYSDEPITYIDYEGNTKTIEKLADNEMIINANNLNSTAFYEELNKVGNATKEDRDKVAVKYITTKMNRTPSIGKIKHYSRIDEHTNDNNKPTDVKEFKIIGYINDENNLDIYFPKSYLSTMIPDKLNISSLMLDKKDVDSALDCLANNVDYRVNSIYASDVQMVSYISDTLTPVLFYVGLGLLIFSSLLMMNFITTSINYRKKDIGILRSIGATSTDIMKIFIWEGIFLALISIVIALLGSLGCSYFFNNWINNVMSIEVDLIIITLKQPIVILALSALLVFIANLFPIFKISRQKPIDVILDK
ncbi:MAG: ATP-binding cassette domain-containing protein [Erysipelotrichaceae bacterium]